MSDFDNEEVKKAEEKVKAAEAAAEEARKEAERIAKKAKEEAESNKKAEEAKIEADKKAEEAKKEAEKKAEEDKKAEEAKIEAEKKAEEAKKVAEAKKAEEDAAQKQQEAAAAKEAKRNEKKAKIQALKDQCPPQYKPVGTSAFFWLGILCWLPFLGVLISLIMSIFPKNRNIKSFARSKLAYYTIIFIACLIITLVAGAVIPEDNKIEIANALMKISRSLGFAV